MPGPEELEWLVEFAEHVGFAGLGSGPVRLGLGELVETSKRGSWATLERPLALGTVVEVRQAVLRMGRRAAC